MYVCYQLRTKKIVFYFDFDFYFFFILLFFYFLFFIFLLTGDKKVNHKLKCRSINQLTTEKTTKYYKDQPTLLQNKLCINILLTKYTELDKN